MKKLLTNSLIVSLIGLLIAICGPKPVAGESVKIGVLGPMGHMPGEHCWYGAVIAAEEINKAGGILVGKVKRPIELIKIDTNELAAIPDAILAVERAITVNKVDFLVGGYSSEAIIAMEDTVVRNKKIWLVSPGGHPEVVKRVRTDYERYKYIFRAIAGTPTGVVKICVPLLEMVGNSVRRELGAKRPKIAILAVKVMWPDGFIKEAKEYAISTGMDIVGEWRPSHLSTDLTAEFTAIKAAGAHIIFSCMGGPVNIVYGKQWGELKIPAASVGWSVEASDLGYWKATKGEANDELTASIFAPVQVTPRAVPFYDKFVKLAGGRSPTQSACTYDGVWVMKEAIERAGTLDSDVVVAKLEKTDFLGAQGRMVYSGLDSVEPHSVVYGPEYFHGFGVQWQDGELVCVWPPADGSYHGKIYQGIKKYRLPQRVVEYWKGK